jgi:hypothetical protein
MKEGEKREEIDEGRGKGKEVKNKIISIGKRRGD